MLTIKEKKDFLKRITDQATLNGNSVCVGHYINNGTDEINYPKYFTINGEDYYWAIGGKKIKGKSMSKSNELWVHGPGIDSQKN